MATPTMYCCSCCALHMSTPPCIVAIVVVHCTCQHLPCNVALVVVHYTCQYLPCIVAIVVHCTCKHLPCIVAIIVVHCTCQHLPCIVAIVVVHCTCQHLPCIVALVALHMMSTPTMYYCHGLIYIMISSLNRFKNALMIHAAVLFTATFFKDLITVAQKTTNQTVTSATFGQV